jgi:hypothetical protein
MYGWTAGAAGRRPVQVLELALILPPTTPGCTLSSMRLPSCAYAHMLMNY